jgi:hypothetical protein
MSADVVALLRDAERITAICHENPDADTLGAGLAIRIIAERLGKTGEVVCADPPPPMLSFMPRIDDVRRAPQLEPDVAVIVDAGDMSRTGTVAAEHAGWLERRQQIRIIRHMKLLKTINAGHAGPPPTQCRRQRLPTDIHCHWHVGLRSDFIQAASEPAETGSLLGVEPSRMPDGHALKVRTAGIGVSHPLDNIQPTRLP